MDILLRLRSNCILWDLKMLGAMCETYGSTDSGKDNTRRKNTSDEIFEKYS